MLVFKSILIIRLNYPLKNQYSENTDIDNPNEPKPLPKENKRIDKAITKLKLER